ncbi:hypothetical protein CHARACLAT_012477 [Characodon lateralis]|uniref:Uncharacterized protein n=1 Tax=Characodon lateralis TaxID=208331 RepID=A0ABU7DSQ5_9TELE|nr:hypothetical protein [Characodon lateralis]
MNIIKYIIIRSVKCSPVNTSPIWLWYLDNSERGEPSSDITEQQNFVHHSGSQESWCLSQAVSAGGRVHPGQVASPLQGNTQTTKHTPKGNLEKPIKQSCFWTVRGSRSTRREPTHAWGEHANSRQKDPRQRIEPRTLLLQGNSATNCATVQLYPTSNIP